MKSGPPRAASPNLALNFVDPPRLTCVNRSAGVILVVLILLSLNVAAGYDAVLSGILRLMGRARNLATRLGGRLH